MTRADEIREMFAYDRWANEQMLEAVAALPPEQFTRDMGSSFRSVRDTVAHLLGAEKVWVDRWMETPSAVMPTEWSQLSAAELRGRAQEVGAEVASFVAGLSDADLDRDLTFRNLKGEPFTSPLGQLLRHVANHSTYHRGQVTTLLRQLGAAPPSTDLVRWYRMGKP